MNPGDITTTTIHGHECNCEILAVARWSIDVMRLSDEKCFRISGVVNELEKQ